MAERKSSDEQVKDFIETGSDIAGGAVGAAVGLLVGGSAGAVGPRFPFTVSASLWWGLRSKKLGKPNEGSS
jgi:hypothetical protein